MSAKKSRWIGVFAVILLAFYLSIRLTETSDDAKIQEALQESIRAGREGRAGGVLEFLSNSFKFNKESAPSTFDIGRFVRSSHPDVTLVNSNPQLDASGETATVQTPVKVKFRIMGIGTETERELKSVRIELKKESGRRWLVFPSSVWRISSVEAPDVNLSDFISP